MYGELHAKTKPRISMISSRWPIESRGNAAAESADFNNDSLGCGIRRARLSRPNTSIKRILIAQAQCECRFKQRRGDLPVRVLVGVRVAVRSNNRVEELE